MITTSNFYKSYQLHHHKAKAAILNKLLQEQTFKAEDLIEPLWGFSKEDYDRTLRIEMRTNLFHAIETLFTLYFCLQPDDKGKVDDQKLFYNISKRAFHYDKIRKIADGTDDLSVLQTNVKFGEVDVQFGQYLFYYGMMQDKFPPGLEDSLEAIKHGLRNLAIEMSGTAEYNSYKHALRSIPAILEFAFAKKDTLEIVQSFDTKNSMTYFQEFKDNSFSYETKIFDTDRDYKMTMMASNFIYHIIMFRRASIVRDLPQIPLGYFGKEDVDDCLKRNVPAIQFTNSFKPVPSAK